MTWQATESNAGMLLLDMLKKHTWMLYENTFMIDDIKYEEIETSNKNKVKTK